MTDFKVRKNPALPAIPSESDLQNFDRIIKWRRGHLSVLQKLHSDVYKDITNSANDTANDIANLANDTANSLAAIVQGSQYTWFLNEFANSPYTVGTWTFVQNSNQMFNGYVRNTSAANNDMLTQSLSFSAGWYFVSIIGVRTANSGRFVIMDQDDNVWRTFDMYNSTTQYNYAANSIHILPANEAGALNIFFKIVGKNASSTGYNAHISMVNIQRLI